MTQLTDTPNRIAVNINKANYSHHVIKQTGVLNVNCLSVDAPFSVFQQFGFQTGRSVDKFAGQKVYRSDNGLVFLDKYINAFMSLKVEQYVDLGTHGMFICSVTEARVMNDLDTMTYTYYQKNVKPKPETDGKKASSAKYAATSTKVTSSRMTSSARCANMELQISSPSDKNNQINFSRQRRIQILCCLITGNSNSCCTLWGKSAISIFAGIPFRQRILSIYSTPFEDFEYLFHVIRIISTANQLQVRNSGLL